ncbi:unnamed protein product [Hermetia illucens]|uniref:Uncharacterized protein n=1 Tax=Hermetia illucens TaxID=343691 RepID=A0A7R8Z3D3_HERIL|nr:unnamed protein product [Hermetia illucens]
MGLPEKIFYKIIASVQLLQILLGHHNTEREKELCDDDDDAKCENLEEEPQPGEFLVVIGAEILIASDYQQEESIALNRVGTCVEALENLNSDSMFKLAIEQMNQADESW